MEIDETFIGHPNLTMSHHRIYRVESVEWGSNYKFDGGTDVIRDRLANKQNMGSHITELQRYTNTLRQTALRNFFCMI